MEKEEGGRIETDRKGRRHARSEGRRKRRNSWNLIATASARIMFQGTDNAGRGGRGKEGDVESEFTLLM